MASLKDRVAIVTGGARGIGGATARRLAEEGAKVLVADVNGEWAEENAKRIRQSGGQAKACVTDLSKRDDIEAMVKRAVDVWGRLDILVNNGWGRKEPDGSAETLSESSWDWVMNILTKAIFLGVKFAVPEMVKTGGGAIVNTASVHGLLAAPNTLAYDTAKTAVVGMTRQMAIDFGPKGIRVKNPGLFALTEAQYPVRRAGKPEDIANAVRFLCSDEASFITGQSLAVDGGLTIQLQENFGWAQAKFYRDHPDIELR